jgi:AcrR family transcriptional regulator
MNYMSRRYEQKRRAERQDETRRRIVEAAITLHGTIGMAGTTVTRIAELAGVGRQTVYRHFPDELALGRACSGLYWERNPFPALEPWRVVVDPSERLRLGLLESYAYHRRTEAMISLALADAADSPIMQHYHDHWRRAADIIASAWREHGHPLALLRAAIVFPTWRSLVRVQGLTDEQAVELMHRLTCDCESDSS